jgi:hypothetical protein
MQGDTTNSNIIVEKNFEVNTEEQAFLDFLMSSDCPYYIQKAYSNEKENNMFVWAHSFMTRDEQKRPVEGRINSELYLHVHKIFTRFCSENNIKVNTIFRACANATSSAPFKHSQIHVDHADFEHNNFLLYLNDVGGNTYLFDDNDNITYEITPAKNKVVVFKGCPHAQGFCSQEKYRFVVVVTFN